ncbi:winged helix-turn-helix transcriptional regulator [Nocardioides cavernaquae]|uniref:Transcriptional regulator n=1 Tax=Nocardioides cavernaquae TaxID=2321396 RepID=A0A3A5H7X8_9ACTN|nr:helix-turn-helix domain-containing protein [Nocardioides cavernaquae]RJS46766.1 transcriptional regulator [Nocardioides cavernaquae]
MTIQTGGRLAARGDAPLGDRCPIDRTLQLLGNRTALLLLRESFYGATRFDQLWKRVGVTEASASQRLRELVAAGVLTKEPYQEPGKRTRFEYLLTPSGHDLMPVILGLFQWGADHVPERSGPEVTHDGCGAPARVVVRCDAGHEVAESEVLIAGGGPAR